jgi:hypothetical protein
MLNLEQITDEVGRGTVPWDPIQLNDGGRREDLLWGPARTDLEPLLRRGPQP